MSSIVLSGDTSGTVTVAVPAVAGTNTVTIPSQTGVLPVMPTANTLGPGNSTAYKNKFINGNFDIWQRGTTNTITTSGITAADRWQYITDGTLSTGSVFTQQTFTVGQTEVPNNPTYFLNWQYTSVNTPGNYIRQRIENVATFSGQTITVSVWVKCSSGTVAMNFSYQQEFGTGGSPSAGVYSSGTAFTATTTWTQFTATFNIPSISGKTIGTNNNSALNIVIAAPTSGSSTISISQAQVELGSQATAFDVRFLGTELAMCQRYFYQGVLSGSGCSNGGTAQYNFTKFPQIMRTTPTISWISGGRVGTGVIDTAITGLSSVIGGTTNDAILTMTTTTFGVGGAGIVMYSSPIFSLNAEL